jgi:hypothetical protein
MADGEREQETGVNLRKQARGRECQVRLSGICNGNPETTVLAHVRLIGISGFGIKALDILGAHCCSSCHAYADSHHDAETNAAFAEGVFRTQAILIKEGKIKT